MFFELIKKELFRTQQIKDCACFISIIIASSNSFSASERRAIEDSAFSEIMFTYSSDYSFIVAINTTMTVINLVFKHKLIMIIKKHSLNILYYFVEIFEIVSVSFNVRLFTWIIL